MRKGQIFSLILAGSMSLVGCGGGGGDGLTDVSLVASRNLWSTVPVIAEQQGFFEEEGLEVNIKYVQAARFAMDAIVSDTSDLGTVVEINIAYLGLSGNEDISLVTTIVQSNDSAIIARRDAGVSGPQDLAGKRLGVLGGTTSEIFADRFLEAYGVDPRLIDVQSLQPVAMQTALVESGIDAASIWQPFIYNIERALGEENVVIFRDADAYTGYMNIAGRKDWLEQNTDTMAAFDRAQERALDFIQANPGEAQAIMSESINLDIEIVQAIWKEYTFSTTLQREDLLAAITSEANWIVKTQSRFEGPVPDFSAYLSSDD